MESHWGRLIRRSIMACVFVGLVFGSFMAFSIFGVNPSNDDSRRWALDWRASVLRNGWASTPSMTPEQLQQRRWNGESVWLVDVREADEQSVSMIPGALTVAGYEQRLRSEDPPLIVAYCTMGFRSGVFTDQQRAQGRDVVNLSGGIVAWTHVDGDLVDPGTGRATKYVHVYSSYWNLVASGYTAQW